MADNQNLNKRKRDDNMCPVRRYAPESFHIEGTIIKSLNNWILSLEKTDILTSHVKNLPRYKECHLATVKKHGGITSFIKKFGGNIIKNGQQTNKNGIIKPIIVVIV